MATLSVVAAMKAVRLHRRGDPAAFVYEDAPRPTPGDGEVVIRVHAAAVTPTELRWAPTSTTRSGALRPLPIILGHEFSGEIGAVGPGVSGARQGDAVYGMNDWFGDGAQTEYCVARAVDIAPKPRRASHVEAAVTPISALTAWQGPNRAQLAEVALLIDAGDLRPIVGAVFPLAEATRAYAHKPVHGKSVLRVVD